MMIWHGMGRHARGCYIYTFSHGIMVHVLVRSPFRSRSAMFAFWLHGVCLNREVVCIYATAAPRRAHAYVYASWRRDAPRVVRQDTGLLRGYALTYVRCMVKWGSRKASEQAGKLESQVHESESEESIVRFVDPVKKKARQGKTG